MLPDPAFRLSFYLTLVVACACLGYAEFALLPEVGVFAGVVVGALAGTYRLETRNRLLTIPDANKLGAGIGLVWLLWAAYRVVREIQTNEFLNLGWPLFFIALVAPLLMAVIVAKALRGEKHAGDYWALYGCGLWSVVIGCAMAEKVAVFVLMAVFAALAVWTLTLFYLARAGGAVPPIPAAKPRKAAPVRPRAVATESPRSWWATARPLAWTAAALAVAVPLYLVTPRSPFGKLDFGGQRIEIGYAADQMVNLNATGTLAENPEEAFEVLAEDDAGRPKDDLSTEQRWRGAVLTHYRGGAWQKEVLLESPFPLLERTATRPAAWTPPDLGPGRYRLTFDVPVKLRSFPLADPVQWLPGQPVPLADLTGDGQQHPWQQIRDGSFVRTSPANTSQSVARYVQYTCPPAEPDLGPAVTLDGPIPREIVNNPVKGVKTFADRVLEKLVQERQLPRAALNRDAVNFRLPDEHHEAVARAFCSYLAEGAGLKYTTALRRVNKDVDPVEEFLTETRAGHCERFATALVLMLRSQGIPAVLVLGFKGCEPNPLGGGRYVVRHSTAHAWAEVLISRPAAPTGRGGRGSVWHWLSLDPTPAELDETPAAGTGEEGVAGGVKALFERYFVRYTPERQEQTVRGVADAVTSREAVTGVGGVVLVVGLVWAGWLVATTRRPAQPPAAARWLDRLFAVLKAGGYAPGPGDTPREFAATVAAALRLRPETAGVADVPVRWAAAYYQTRFGGATLSDDTRAELDAKLDALGRALKSKKGGTP